MLSITLQRLLKILQMLPVINATIPNNIHREQAILVRSRDLPNHKGLVDSRSYGEGVVARSEDKVGERGGTDEVAVDVVVEGHVAHGDGHDGGVGDVDRADHVGAVGVGDELDAEGGYVEACEAVETCGLMVNILRWVYIGLRGEPDDTFHGDCLVVVYRYHWEAPLVKLGAALDDQVYGLFG